MIKQVDKFERLVSKIKFKYADDSTKSSGSSGRIALRRLISQLHNSHPGQAQLP